MTGEPCRSRVYKLASWTTFGHAYRIIRARNTPHRIDRSIDRSLAHVAKNAIVVLFVFPRRRCASMAGIFKELRAEANQARQFCRVCFKIVRKIEILPGAVVYAQQLFSRGDVLFILTGFSPREGNTLGRSFAFSKHIILGL